tara:strand:+ start:49 stop:300 length:252 start_codon:yes stop_codon:yes gene_type:complete
MADKDNKNIGAKTPSRVRTLLQLMDDAREKGDTDQVEQIKQELFLLGGFSEGGVSLDFEEGEVASSMFTGGAAIKGRNFSGNY